jgi:hypothetical protein
MIPYRDIDVDYACCGGYHDSGLGDIEMWGKASTARPLPTGVATRGGRRA